ncbi:unnamed protein product [Schistocephalus solidus]|uniref:Mediator of RNA polymerase II transcription subunit 13 n=1 Tax=Schistocephalus solidus TaxID=70667 RepID=A0A183TPQ3_SCHSO|nr:unnamed protein product [Schistocephalus solidus]
MQAWPSECRLMLIQVERDSLIVQSLKAPMLHIPLQLSFENGAQEADIISCLRWHTESALTLGIISSLPNLNTPVPSGLIAFACLFLAKGNRICVLALTNSEEFRLELLMHQSSKKQQQLQQQSIAQSQLPPQQQQQQLSQPSFPQSAMYEQQQQHQQQQQAISCPVSISGHEMMSSHLSSPSSPSAKFSRQSGMVGLLCHPFISMQGFCPYKTYFDRALDGTKRQPVRSYSRDRDTGKRGNLFPWRVLVTGLIHSSFPIPTRSR